MRSSLPDTRLTFECVHCSKLIEVDFWKFEIIFDGTVVGICERCDRKVVIRLFTEAVEEDEKERIKHVLRLENGN